MKLTLFFDHRFQRSADGVLYSPTSYNYDLFTSRYLSVFDELTIVARVQDQPNGERAGKYVEGPRVRVRPVGNWQGPIQYTRARRQVAETVREEVQQAEAMIMIAPGRIGQVATSAILREPRPYGLEVVGDPGDVFAPGATNHPLRPLLQRWATRELRKQAAAATSVAYVSRVNLPERYPAAADAFVTNYSSIELQDEHLIDEVGHVQVDRSDVRLVTIGTLSQMYKGIDVLIDALALLVNEGVNGTLTVVGDGRFRKDLEARANGAGLGERVRFLGHLPAGDAVRAELDKADLFVLASRTEGLPRAMIEAMARGLPCVGTLVGGIPELLPPEDMVEPGNPRALADKITEVIGNPARLEAMARRNLDTARSYRASILWERRSEMYTTLKEQTREWLNKHGR
jgi:glycosyltransferase involved in cell wall biosynthesis